MMQSLGSSASAAAAAAAGSSSSAIAPAASAYGAGSFAADQALVVDRIRHPSGIVPSLQNIVSTVNLGCTLDLKAIAMRARNAEFNPKRFSAVVMRIRDPKTTALIFHSGKMVITGARSEELSRLAARKYARIIQKLGFAVSFLDFTVQNMVGTADVRFPVRLEGLASEHEDFTTYEPELFPGLIYRMVQPKVVLLIFVSGKVVMTGAKNREHIYEAFEYIYPVLTEYRKEIVQSIQPQMTLQTLTHSGPGGLGSSTAAKDAALSAAASAKLKRAQAKNEKIKERKKNREAKKAAAAAAAATAASEPAQPAAMDASQ